jgi:N-methylhydantoinase B/oxoprolinase/acetone carboxylase alpha subunit
MTRIRMRRRRRISSPKHLSKGEGFELLAGDWIEVNTPGGGGYGPPAKRDADRVARDVRRGYLSATQARAEYGHRMEAKTHRPDAKKSQAKKTRKKGRIREYSRRK